MASGTIRPHDTPVHHSSCRPENSRPQHLTISLCHVTRALQGVVLKTLEVARDFISQTSTDAGLHVVVEIARRVYHKGRKATEQFLNEMPIVFNSFLPELNYTALP